MKSKCSFLAGLLLSASVCWLSQSVCPDIAARRTCRLFLSFFCDLDLEERPPCDTSQTRATTGRISIGSHPLREEPFPNAQPEPPLSQLRAVPSGPQTEEISACPSTPPLQKPVIVASLLKELISYPHSTTESLTPLK